MGTLCGRQQRYEIEWANQQKSVFPREYYFQISHSSYHSSLGRLAVGTSNGYKILNPETFESIYEHCSRAEVSQIHIINDHIVAFSLIFGKIVDIWDYQTSTLLERFTMDTNIASLLSNSEFLAVETLNEIALYEMKCRPSLSFEEKDHIEAFSVNGRYTFSSRDSNILYCSKSMEEGVLLIYDIITQEEQQPLCCSEFPIVKIQSTKNLLAVALDNGNILLYSSTDLSFVFRIGSPNITQLDFIMNEESTFLITATQKGLIHIYCLCLDKSHFSTMPCMKPIMTAYLSYFKNGLCSFSIYLRKDKFKRLYVQASDGTLFKLDILIPEKFILVNGTHFIEDTYNSV